MYLKWFLTLVIYAVILYFNIFHRLNFTVGTFFLVSGLLGMTIFFGLLFIIKYRISDENKHCGNEMDVPVKKDIIISTVFKNEGNTVVDTAKHYLDFTTKPKIIFYDDGSDDGSFQSLEKIETENECVFKIIRLEKTDKILHPKGMGFEDLIKNYGCDYYIIIDADTLIDEASVEKALRIMQKKNISVLHFTRRNDLSDEIANNIADTEELFSSINKLIGIFPWYFNGSGFIMKSEIARKMVYDDYSPSDDCQIGFFLRKNHIKVFDALTLFAHEKAPKSLSKLLKQHSAWTKGGIHHYMEKEKLTIFPLAFISAYFLSALVNPLGIYNIFLPLAFAFIWSSDFLANLLLAGRSAGKSAGNAFIHFATLFFKGVVIVPFHILCFPFKRYSFWFKRTQY